MLSYAYAATPPRLDIRKSGKRLSVKHHPLEEKPQEGGYLSGKPSGVVALRWNKSQAKRPGDLFRRFLYFQSLTLQTCEYRVSSEVNLLRGWP